MCIRHIDNKNLRARQRVLVQMNKAKWTRIRMMLFLKIAAKISYPGCFLCTVYSSTKKCAPEYKLSTRWRPWIGSSKSSVMWLIRWLRQMQLETLTKHVTTLFMWGKNLTKSTLNYYMCGLSWTSQVTTIDHKYAVQCFYSTSKSIAAHNLTLRYIMDREVDDSTNCPICFEPHEEAGDHLPRLLPCTHTLCHTRSHTLTYWNHLY